jgi:antitoxin component YwqK of YwqJK toxin-antitoxin module
MRASTLIILFFSFGLIISCSNKGSDVLEEFYPDGSIKSETQVKNGMRNGLTKNFDEKGRIIATAEYVNDTLEGFTINYNPENGKVTAQALYKNNNQHGPATLYYTDGSLYREMFYVEGRVDSIVKTYWADGKQQAEVFFKKGNPAIGLKEWDKDGNPVQHPYIIVKEINRLSAENKFRLKVSLSEKQNDVEFYAGSLIDGKFFDPKSVKLKSIDGETILEYVVPKNKSLKTTVSIIARMRTEYGNTLLINKNYTFSVKN